MFDNGWIKIHRKMVDWEWYDDANVMRVFLHLLITANHRDKKWRGVVIKAGQKVTSYQNLADELSLSVRQVRTALGKLESTGEIQVKTTNKYTLINVGNYTIYQGSGGDSDKQTTNKRQSNDNQMADKWQSNDNQMSTNKNEKNEKNEKNDKKDTLTSSQSDDDRVPHREIVDLFNEMLGGPLPRVEKLTKSRKNKIRVRWNDGLDHIDKWKNLYGEVIASDFLMGDKTDWKATFDWLIANDKNWVKVKEGNYRNEEDARKSRDRFEPEEGSGYIEIL